jgi:hypothetical protein
VPAVKDQSAILEHSRVVFSTSAAGLPAGTVAPIVARRVEPVAVRGQVRTAPDVPLAGVTIVVSTPDAGDTGGWRATLTDAAGRFTAELYRGVRYRV